MNREEFRALLLVEQINPPLDWSHVKNIRIVQLLGEQWQLWYPVSNNSGEFRIGTSGVGRAPDIVGRGPTMEIAWLAMTVEMERRLETGEIFPLH